MISRSFTTLLLALASIVGIAKAEVVVGYYRPGSSGLTIHDVPLYQYNHINYFAATQSDPSPTTEFKVNNEQDLQAVVARIHTAIPLGQNVPKTVSQPMQTTTISISFGGWVGSRSLSDAMSTADSRTKLAASMVAFMKKYNLDGIDVAWVHYPADTCYKKQPGDTDNFLALLQQLKSTIGDGKLLTASVSMQVFLDRNGQPVKDLSAFAKVLDRLHILAFNAFGPGFYPNAKAGPVAPLYDYCLPDFAKQSGSSALKAWTAAGFPAEKIVLTSTTLGYTYTTASQALARTDYQDNGILHSTLAIQDAQPNFKWKIARRDAATETCGLQDIDAATKSYLEISNAVYGLEVQNKKAAKPSPVPGMYTDSCSESDFLYEPSSQQLIHYESPRSLQAKAVFVKMNNLAGIGLFDILGDSNEHDLINNATMITKL